jgi:NAD(P)H-hydrate epimerase
VPQPVNAVLEVKSTCVITAPMPATPEGAFAAEAAGAVRDLATGCSVMVVGPGLGTRPATADFLARLLPGVRCPIVVDADALNILADRRDVLETVARSVPVVVTPHPGECARLTSSTIDEIQARRREMARQLAQRTGAVVVLKGHATAVTDGEHDYVNGTGNPGMATAGTGDVLAGMVGAFIAQGLSAFDAACLAVERHGAAGDIAAESLGFLGMTAEDILAAVPEALRAPGQR